ncbi:hypothetical protein D3C73_1502200 [compost metagenome]
MIEFHIADLADAVELQPALQLIPIWAAVRAHEKRSAIYALSLFIFGTGDDDKLFLDL